MWATVTISLWLCSALGRISVLPAAQALPSSRSASTVNVCGTIAADTTWTASNVYVVTCDVTVEPGATLRIEAGTVVKLTLSLYGSNGLIINGQLEAAGTAEAPVVFTSLEDDEYGGDTNGDGAATTGAPGQWSAITFGSGSRGRLTYAIVRYGGGYYYFYGTKALIRNFGGDVVLDRVTLEGSGMYGLYAESPVTVTRSRIAGNNSAGLYYNRPGMGSGLEITDNVFSGWAGQVAFAEDRNPGPVTLRGNRGDSGSVPFTLGGVLRNALTWDNGSDFVMSLQSEGDFEVAAGGSLILAPGSVVKSGFNRYSESGNLIINGHFEATGTAEAPIVFTSLEDDEYGGDTNGDGAATSPSPGDWGAITFGSGSRGRLAHAIVRYGGGDYYHYSTKALFRNFGGDVVLEKVELTQSGAVGVYAENGPMTLRKCRVTANRTHGVFNSTPKFAVDARQVWWGDPSGPYHRTKNPGGSGDEVSDGVLFFPWAADEAGTVPTQVLVEGPARVSPGDSSEYAVSYFAGEPLEDAVLIAVLPAAGEFVDATGGAIFWPERHEVYWRLGSLAEKQGSYSVRLRFAWGVPDGSSDNLLALIAASNLPAAPDVSDYLGRDPRFITSETALSEAELEAELAGNGELAALFGAAVEEGFLLPQAARVSTSRGESAIVVTLMHPERGALLFLSLAGGRVAGVRYERQAFRMYDSAGGMEWDLALDRFSSWGTWAEQPLAARAAAGSLSFARCFFNCVAPKLSLAVVKKTVKTIGLAFKISSCFTCGLSKGANVEACAKCQNTIRPLLTVEYVPGLGKRVPVMGEVIDVTKCAADCAGQQGVVFPCREDLLTCDNSAARSVWTSVFEQCSFRRIPCENGLLVPEKSYVVNSGCFNDFCKCVEGKGCVRCPQSGPRTSLQITTRAAGCGARDAGALGATGTRAAAGEDATCSIRRTAIRAARDPNAKSGHAGDVTPGQELTYTVEYENVGVGRAYGVYVTDELSPHLDETTLDLRGEGEFLPATRTILWEVGELAPKGEAGSKGERTFTVRVKPALPSGTVITNQAIVHFPSVPEETATNTVVNAVQPLVAERQSLETSYGTPLAIELRGRDVSGAPLTYALQEPPLNGELTGMPPSLTYTPAANFTGLDRFTFTVNNGVSQSRPAEIMIMVRPSAADRTAPMVLWTYPEHGAVLDRVPREPVATDPSGPLYAPFVLVSFSEAMEPNTINAASIRLEGPNGPIVASASWDGTANAAVLVAREPWVPGVYTATLTTAALDASGNALQADHAWSFTVRAVAGLCFGDCNGDGEVTIDELVRGVNIALGILPLDACPSFDSGGDGEVTIEELIAAVNDALAGC